MGVVKAFHALRQGFQSQNSRQLRKRALAALPGPLLQRGVLFQRVDAVAVAQAGKLRLVAPLRPVQANAAAPGRGQPGLNLRKLRGLAVYENLRRDAVRLRIVLLEKSGHDIRVAFVRQSAHAEPLRADDLAVAHKQRKDQNRAVQPAHGEHIRHGMVDADDHLLIGKGSDGVDAIAQVGSPLKIERCGRGLHLRLQLAQHPRRIARKEGDDLREHRVVFLAADLAGAGRAALAHMVHQTGPLAPGDGPFEILFAVADGEMIAHHVHALAQQQGGEIGAKIARAVLFYAADDLNAGKILPKIDAHIGKVLVVLEQDVVLGLELLDEIALQRERLRLVGYADRFKVRDVPHHGGDLCRLVFAALEILPYAVFQGDCFADIDDLARLVEHLVDAGGGGQEPELFLDDLVHAGLPGPERGKSPPSSAPASFSMRYRSGSGRPMTLK